MTDNSTENTVKTDGPKPWRFKKGQSGNPQGKPKGTRNKATLMARDLFEKNSEALTQKIIDLALEGDLTALKICIDRVCPPIKSQAQKIDIPMINGKDLTETAKVILDSIANGEIAPDIGSQIISSLAVIAKTEELEKLKSRIEAIEISTMAGVEK